MGATLLRVEVLDLIKVLKDSGNVPRVCPVSASSFMSRTVLEDHGPVWGTTARLWDRGPVWRSTTRSGGPRPGLGDRGPVWRTAARSGGPGPGLGDRGPVWGNV